MFIAILQFLTVGRRVIKMTSFRCKASRAPVAVLSTGVDRTGHRISRGLQNGGLFTFTSKFALLTIVGI